jgi:hypothetical protein
VALGKMIVAMLQGGMGNQMFEYAMGLARAKELNTELVLDVTSLLTEPLRIYNLGLWRGVTERIFHNSTPTVWEPEQFKYDPNLVVKDNDVLLGYWQNEKWFRNIRQELLEIFKPKQRITPRGLETFQKIWDVGNRSTFLSVRRTDYVGSDFHNVLDREYYLEACKLVSRHTPNPHFFVFSDEPEWCRQNFYIPYEFSVVSTPDQTNKNHLGREDEDLWLMSKCKNAVLANSSFSWWGAWLNTEPYDQMVVAPKKWFHADIDTSDLNPERWVRI